MLFRKTPTNERGNYRYHSVTGETFVITPEEVGEENIRLLHRSDDAIVYNNIKNSRPQIQEWQRAGIEQWKAMHPGEEVPKNWNLSLDGLTQTEDADHSSYMKELAEKRAEYNLELAKYDFAVPDTLDEAEISYILTRADELAKWAGDVKEYALEQALNGTSYPGFKVVEGRSVRKYTDEDAVAFAVKDNGFDPYEKKLLGITAMTSLLGKKKFEELLGGLTYKPPGKPALVPESDKRPAMNTAAEDFK